jgi:hypothetical protein
MIRLSRARGAPAFVGESNLIRTPETMRTVAVACATTCAGLLAGEKAGTVVTTAVTASQNIIGGVTPSVHNGKQAGKNRSIMERIGCAAAALRLLNPFARGAALPVAAALRAADFS